VPDKGVLSGIDKVVLVCHDDSEFHINRSSELVVSVAGLCEVFGNDAVLPLITKVMERAVVEDPRSRKGTVVSYWNVQGTTVVARHYLRSLADDRLCKQVEIWQARHHFDEGRLTVLYHFVVPKEEQDEKFQLPSRKEWLNWLVDWFYSLGWSLHHVQREFIEWLENHAEQGLPEEYLIAVAGAKCFQPYSVLPEVASALHKYLGRCWEQLANEYINCMTISGFKQLGQLGMFSRGHADFFRNELIKLLSEGKAAKVSRLLAGLGCHMGLCEWGNYAKGSEIEKSVRATFDSMGVAAFDKAFEAGRFGIAAAIGQYFNCVDEAALRLKANRAFREKLEAVIVWEKVVDRPKNPEEFWDQVLEGELTQATDDDLPAHGRWKQTKTHRRGVVSGFDWMVEPLTEEQKTILPQIQAERDNLLKELIRLRKVQISEAVETAMVVEQPIAFDLVTLL
jgi:hypothetical protein